LASLAGWKPTWKPTDQALIQSGPFDRILLLHGVILSSGGIR